MKERWFNYRPLCLIFAFLLLGSVFSFYSIKHIYTAIIIMALIITALLILAIYKKKPQYVLVPIIAFVLGIACYFAAINRFNQTVDFSPKVIQARIYDVNFEQDGVLKVEADSVVFDKQKIKDNIIIYVYDNDGLYKNLEVGSVINFKPNKLHKSELLYYDTPNSNLYIKDLKYTAITFMKDVEYVKTDKNFSEKIQERIKENLKNGLTNENVEIAYSALFGDKDMLSHKQYDTYKLSGVAHLLAVSGLHVGIIVGLINWLCKKLKIKNWYKFAIVAVFLMFYTYICGYAVSIIRASVMALILILSQIMHKQYDSFNAISVAGIIIFLINPFCVFDVAFLLSFSCVIGITMLYRPIRRTLAKFHINPKIRDAVAISLATSVSIIVINAYYFTTLNVISIIANVIIIPIFTLAFTVLFALAMASLLLPFITYLLYPLNFLFNVLNLFATMFANLAISNFNTIDFNFIGIIIYFVILLFLGRFCTAKYQYKILTTLPMIALLFCALL